MIPTALRAFIPFTKRDDEQRMVYGYASTEALDSDGEIIEKDAIEAALPDFMRFANIREMHVASAVGKAKEAQIDEKGLYIGAKIVDDAAWEKVKEGVYSGFSIAGKALSKIGNRIKGIKLSEISLVDRPANPECVIEVFKSAEEKVDKGGDLKKGMYAVSVLAEVYERLHYLQQASQYEEEQEGDTASKVPALLGEACAKLGEALLTMAAEEVAEMGHSTETKMEKAKKKEEAPAESLAERKASMKGKLSTMKEAMGAYCARIEEMAKEFDAEGLDETKLAALGAELGSMWNGEGWRGKAEEKAEKAELTKLEISETGADGAAQAALVATIAKAAGEKAMTDMKETIAKLTARVEELAKMEVPARGSRTEEQTDKDKIAKADESGKAQTPADVIKGIHNGPPAQALR